MFKIKTNIKDVIANLESLKENPKPLMLSAIKAKYEKAICPDHHSVPEVLDIPDSATQFQFRFCCEKQKELFQSMMP